MHRICQDSNAGVAEGETPADALPHEKTAEDIRAICSDSARIIAVGQDHGGAETDDRQRVRFRHEPDFGGEGPIAKVVSPRVTDLYKVLNRSVDLKLCPRTKAEIEAVHEKGVFVTFQAGERELSLTGVAEAGFHHEGPIRNQAWVFGQERTLLGDCR